MECSFISFDGQYWHQFSLQKIIIVYLQQQMSRIITNTNIIVDDFDFCKSFPKGTFVHFLTHFHSDHYEGLSPLWDYGDIHCSHQTKKFIMNKYPKLKNVFSHDYYNTTTIEIVEQKIDIRFTLFDAKHIPGAAMILFEGYMGTILFTGDFRYEYKMVKQNSILFPPRLREFKEKQQEVEKMSGISIKIDEMIFDNTYCNKAFKFETEDAIALKMIAIIQKNKDKKLIYIAMGALGKHRILMRICEHFQTSIVVSQKQRKKVQLANLRTDFLTTSTDEGYIHLISKKNRAQIVELTKKGPLGDSFICIDTDFLMLDHQSPDKINYIVPYSLHSNYNQMETLIRLIQPSILRKIVIPYANFKHVRYHIKIDHRLKFAKYLDFIEKDLHHSQSGYAYLVKNHTSIHQLSRTYLQWFDPSEQQKLMKILGVGKGIQDHTLSRKQAPPTDDQLTNHSNKSKGKMTLKDIADQLNAVNKNKTIKEAFTKDVNKVTQKHYKNIFGSDYENSQGSQKIYSQIFTEQTQDDEKTENKGYHFV